MKRLIIILFVAMAAVQGFSQNLIDIYKKGTVKLVPDTEYGKGNDWDKVFATYTDTLYGKPMGNRKSINITPDGSVVIDHAYHNYFSKFNPSGKFVKEFYITSETGYQYKKTAGIDGVVNNNTFFGGLDNLGRMLCFDFDGNFKKILKLDYMAKQIIGLPNGKIAVVGWVIWEDRFRDFVAVVDYETNEEKIIWDHFTESCKPGEHCKLFQYSYYFKKGGAVSTNTMPYVRTLGISNPPKIINVGNELIIAYPGNGEIVVCDLDGNVKSRKIIETTKNEITVEEQKEIQQKSIDRHKNTDNIIYGGSRVSEEESKLAMMTMAKLMEEDLAKIKDPIQLPYFSNIIKDSDNNLLVFEFAKEKDANKFNVYVMKNGGEFVCKSSFACDEYEIEITPSKFVFHKGYVYGLVKEKNAEGIPLRLMRFNLN